MQIIGSFLRVTAKRNKRTAERARRSLAAPKGGHAPPKALFARHRVDGRDVAGFPCWTVTPADGTPPNGTVVYVHGGGYVNEIVSWHWRHVDKLVRDVGCRVEVPIYGLAPRYTWRDAFRMLDVLHRDLLARPDTGDVVFQGDSAGGGLALAYAQTLTARGLPQPAALDLIAPWLDVTMTDPDVLALESRDAMLTAVALRVAGEAWAGDTPTDDPVVSPLHGPVADLAPVTVWIGTHDMFWPDCRALAAKLADAGGDVALIERPGGLHAYPLIPTPEARRDRARMFAALRGRFAVAV
jgi:monoterpene epsilon-lactone hydrolase